MEIRDIFIFMYLSASLRITLTVRNKQHISHGQSSPENTADSSIAHTQYGTKGNKLKRRREPGIITRNTKKKKQGWR